MFQRARIRDFRASTSLTGLYLTGGLRVAVPEKHRRHGLAEESTLRSLARRSTICRVLDVSIPLGMMVAVVYRRVRLRQVDARLHQVLVSGPARDGGWDGRRCPAPHDNVERQKP